MSNAEVTQADRLERMVSELHGKLVRGTPAADELCRAARKVVEERYHGSGEWDDLNATIGELANVLDRAAEGGGT